MEGNATRAEVERVIHNISGTILTADTRHPLDLPFGSFLYQVSTSTSDRQENCREERVSIRTGLPSIIIIRLNRNATRENRFKESDEKTQEVLSRDVGQSARVEALVSLIEARK